MANIIFSTGDLELKTIEQNYSERYPGQFEFILENGTVLTIWAKGKMEWELEKLVNNMREKKDEK